MGRPRTEEQKEAARERARRWYQENRDYVLARLRIERRTPEHDEWLAAHREERNEQQRKRRANWTPEQQEKHRSRNRQALQRRYAARARVFRMVKKARGCQVCGLRDPMQLHFHHRDPSAKRAKVSGGLLLSKMSRILEELAKCDVLCGPCHRDRHRQMRAGTVVPLAPVPETEPERILRMMATRKGRPPRRKDG